MRPDRRVLLAYGYRWHELLVSGRGQLQGEGGVELAALRIGLTPNGITITATGSGLWQLTLPESGRLRGVVREALPDPSMALIHGDSPHSSHRHSPGR